MKTISKYFLIYFSIVIFIFILFGCSGQNIQTSQQEQLEYNTQAVNTSIKSMPGLSTSTSEFESTKNSGIDKNTEVKEEKYFKVVKVVDGDTIDVDFDGKTERIRMIGVNTPETVDPRKPVECMGVEASNKAKELLNNQEVKLEADETQTDRDKYDRLLRYVWRKDGIFYNLEIIKQGYAYEYTFDLPYRYQKDFKAAQEEAKKQKLGLWAENTCTLTENTKNGVLEATSFDSQAISQSSGQTSPETTTQSQDKPQSSNPCVIKGNINSDDEKIYHLPGCGSYNRTVIDTGDGEKWFCTEEEAVSAGWRKAKNCP
jgi:micrococcal nuclease